MSTRIIGTVEWYALGCSKIRWTDADGVRSGKIEVPTDLLVRKSRGKSRRGREKR
jgi:hypothetical protein